MGILFSRFCKNKTTIEILELLDKNIKDIEQYGQSTEQRHKKIVGFLIISSVALYAITAIIFYFYYFPAELYDQLFYVIPLIIFPILILFTKKIVTWYYKRKILRNQEKLILLHKEKKKILDAVIETETYKKAKEILLKFAPDELQLTPPNYKHLSAVFATSKLNTPEVITQPLQAETELRRRSKFCQNNLENKDEVLVKTGFPVPQTSLLSSTPNQIIYKSSNDNRVPSTPLPRPILPQQRSYIDRLVEYVVGDGPNNRYALVCRRCDSHNGMALKEEFEYFAFRCCYCNFWNPAKKQKPSAPKLESDDNSVSSRRIFLQPIRLIESLQHANMIDNQNTDNFSQIDSDVDTVEKTPVSSNSEENKVFNYHDNNIQPAGTIQ